MTTKTVETELTGMAEGLVEAADECAKSYVDAGVDTLHAVSGNARKIARNAAGYVRASPWLAIGAAAGAGVLLGILLRGRRSS